MGNFYSQENTTPSFVAKSEYDTYVSTTPRVLDLNTVLADVTLTQKLLTALANDSQKRFVGPQGVKGDTGLQGIKGDTGLQGIKGDTGSQGIKGDTGSQGIKGDTGLQGPAGVKGDTGLQGPAGPAGVKGDTGSQGIKGDTGLQGIKGDTGLQGQVGPTGPAGATQDLSLYVRMNMRNVAFNSTQYVNSDVLNGAYNQFTITNELGQNTNQGTYLEATAIGAGQGGRNLYLNPRYGGNVYVKYQASDNLPNSELAVKGDINSSGNLIGNGIKIGANNSKICRASLTFNAYNGGTTNSNLTTPSSNGLSISRVNTAMFQINFTGDKPPDTSYIVTSFGIYNQPPTSGANMYGSCYNKTTNGFNLLISTRNNDNTEMSSNGTGFMDICVFW